MPRHPAQPIRLASLAQGKLRLRRVSSTPLDFRRRDPALSPQRRMTKHHCHLTDWWLRLCQPTLPAVPARPKPAARPPRPITNTSGGPMRKLVPALALVLSIASSATAADLVR